MQKLSAKVSKKDPTTSLIKGGPRQPPHSPPLISTPVLDYIQKKELASFYKYNNMAVSILPPKCQRQRLGWSYCAASPKLGRNEVKTKDKPLS